MPKYCPECGNELIGNPKFCTECGNKIIWDESQKTLKSIQSKEAYIKKQEDKSKGKKVEPKEFEEESLDKKPSSKLEKTDTFGSPLSEKSAEESEKEKWRNETLPIASFKKAEISYRYSYRNFILIGILAVTAAFSSMILVVFASIFILKDAAFITYPCCFLPILILSVVYFLLGIYINSKINISKKRVVGKAKKPSRDKQEEEIIDKSILTKAPKREGMARTKKIAIIAPIMIIVFVVLFLVVDADGDGLNNLAEIQEGTGIFDSDSDNDGLNDGDELNNYDTDPLDYDCDNDGISDGIEIDTYGTNPLDDDSDNDGLDDYKEIHTYDTNPLSSDSDSDGLNDKDEIDTYGTDPMDDDTDDDGLNDGDEVELGTDFFDYDTDNDGIEDGYDSHPTIHDWKLMDSDSDGLTDYEEYYEEGTDRFDSDTDGDGAPDGYDAHPLSTSKKTRKYYRWEYPEGTTWTWEIYVSYDLYVYESQLNRISSWSRWSEYTLDPTAKQLANELEETANNKGFNYYQTVNFVLSFVQSLTYTSDDITAGYEYPRYPLETLYEDGGDCEDTSILFSSILREMNYDNYLTILPGHAMVSVWGHDDYQGSYSTKNGKKYYFCETTGEDWKMGKLSPSFDSSEVILYNVDVSNPKIPPTPEPEYDDYEFVDWLVNSISTLGGYITNAGNALSDEDYYSLSYWAGKQKDKTQDYLDEIDDFYLSYNYDNIRDEYEECLYDLKWYSYYLEKTADAMTEEDYDSASTYLSLALEYSNNFQAHLDNVEHMLGNL